MELMANERKIINTQPLDYLFTQGESGVDRIPIVLPLRYGEVDLTALRWSIQLVSEQDTFISKPLVSQAGPEKLTVYWDVDGDCTAAPGKIRLTVVGISESGNEVIKFDGREIMVKAALYGSFVPAPDTLAASLAQVQKYAEEASASAGQARERASAAEGFAQAAERALEKSPQIGENGRWLLYDAALGEYRDSGVSSYGREGKSPYIGEDGYWLQWDQQKGAYQETGVLAQGPAGSVTSVNGALPDEAGNVQLEAGAASGENLLVNPYLASPVNQRGQTSYEDAGGVNTFCIDHWCLVNYTAAQLEADGLAIQSPGQRGNYILTQKIEHFAAFRGKTLTLSLLVSQLSGKVSIGAQFQPDYTGNTVCRAVTSPGLLSVSFTVPEDAAMLWVFFMAADLAPVSAKLAAAKLELGETQTLARQSGAGWTLLDPPPDPALELAKCQRYYYRLEDRASTVNLAIGTGVYGNASRIYFPYSLPAAMRVTPTIIKSDTNADVINSYTSDQHDVFSLSSLALFTESVDHRQVTLRLVSSNADIPRGTLAVVQFAKNAVGWIAFDAEMY
ncbi:MAG: hypothetical protein HFK04_01155 [Oscillospiraceae bacterium]|nr:hypothetical protein [Oscillospiraceae bacterium]